MNNNPTTRNPLDGKGYYCTQCGAGFDDFTTCTAPDCELESDTQAARRAAAYAKICTPIETLETGEET